jgi:hypothetical protein
LGRTAGIAATVALESDFRPEEAMAVDPQLLSQAIHALIYDALTTAPPGSQPVMDSASTVLSLSIPGLPLDPAEFANPWTPLNPEGNPATAENFAWLVDAIPQVSSVYSPNGQSVETLYGQLVQANTPAAPPARFAPPKGARQAALQRLFTATTVTGPRGQAVQTLVETPALRGYLEARAAREDAVLRYMSRLLQVDPSDPAEKQRWEAGAVALKAQLQSTAQAEAAQDTSEIAEAFSTVNAGGGEGQNDSVAALFATARLNFQLSTLGSMFGPGSTWHMTLAQPQNWFAPEASFFDVELKTSKTPRLDARSRVGQSPGLVALNAGLWGFRAQEQLVRRPVTRESLDLRVRFQFARVALRRPWLDTSLFSLGGWALAGRRRLSLSTGTLTDNTGLFPLLPTALIVARNLQISASWSQADLTFIRERLQAKDLTFGPFALSGRYQRPRAAAATAVQARFDGVTITAPQLQAIGRVSQLIPACPPLEG